MKKIFKLLFSVIPFKKQLLTFIRFVFNPGENIYRHLYFKDIFKVPVTETESFMMRHYGYQLENDIFWKGLTGHWEKHSMLTWIKLSKLSKNVLDIGANTGVYSLVTKSVAPGAKVFSYDPVKRVFDKLKENVLLNQFDIQCFNVAVSDHTGKAKFYDTNDEHTYNVVINKDYSNNPLYHPVEIDVITIDDVIVKEKLATIDLIKIDVETHEPEVFKGFTTIMKYHPSILVEVLREDIGHQIESLLNQFGCNYLYFDIDEERGIKQVEHLGKSSGFNYLICTREIAEKIGLK